MSSTTFVARSRLGADAEAAFRWHERPGALERLAPPWERVEVVRAPPGIRNGTRVELRVRLGPLRRTWVAELSGCEAGRRFIDTQVAGPFARWVHEHRFEPRDAASSVLEDRVEYELPIGTLGSAVAGALTRRRLRRAFAWRHEVTSGDLARHAATAGPPLAIGITGASGLIGSALRSFLAAGGHRVVRLSRPGAALSSDARVWDPTGAVPSPAPVEGLDAVVHLAGENIGAGRWTASRKRRILESRDTGTRALVAAIARAARPPRALLCASAIGVYGDRGDEGLDESSIEGSGFLAEVARSWEAAASEAASRGVRVVHLRLGIVVAAAGGAVPRMLRPFRLGLGGPVGSGRQLWSWVALDDVLGAILFVLRHEALSGPVNVVAPAPVTSREFAAILGRVVRRPSAAPLPAAAVRALLGEMGEALLLSSQRVRPARLLDAGFPFRHPALEAALRYELGLRREPPQGIEI